MTLDKTGIDFLKTNEGTNIINGQHVAYQDDVGVWTIGYGHTGNDVYKGLKWSQAKADSTFSSQVASTYGKCVNDSIKKPMTQNQFNAMTDFTYNIGVYGFPTSQTCKKFNAGDTVGAGKAFFGWLKPRSLYSRRVKELALYNSGSKTPVKTTNNQQAVEKANAQKQANAKNTKALEDKLRQQDLRDELDDKKAVEKAKLTKNAQAVKVAQAKAKANQLARENAKKLEDSNKLRKAQADKKAQEKAYKTNNPVKNSISQPKDSQQKNLPTPTKGTPKVLRSGFSILGLFLIAIVMYNVEIPETTIE
jgi:lysozyme